MSKSHFLPATAACEGRFCPFYTETRTWQEAKRLALRHHKETGHVVRAEHIRTLLVGWGTITSVEAKADP